MKRLFTVLGLVVLMLAAALLAQPAATPEPGESILEILQAAYGNEMIAYARYTAFAVKADEEGYKGAASFFRAAAKAEHIHADRFAAILKKKGGEPIAPTYEPDVKTTRENLLMSIDAEREERDSVYLASIQRAKALGEKEVTQLFDLARNAETEHGNLCSIVNATLDDQKRPRTYHVCSHCGYTTDVKLARCPSCMSAKSEMLSVK